MDRQACCVLELVWYEVDSWYKAVVMDRQACCVLEFVWYEVDSWYKAVVMDRQACCLLCCAADSDRSWITHVLFPCLLFSYPRYWSLSWTVPKHTCRVLDLPLICHITGSRPSQKEESVCMKKDIWWITFCMYSQSMLTTKTIRYSAVSTACTAHP